MQLAHVFRELSADQRLNLGVRAPAPWLSTGADNLRVTSFGTVAAVRLVIAIRWLTLQGEILPFVFEHAPASDGSPVQTLHRLSDGWLLTATVQAASGTVPDPGIWVRLDIVAGLTGAVQLVGTLTQGLVSSRAAIAFPLSPIVSAAAGPGTIRTIVGADPAAATEWTVTVPANTRWRLLSVLNFLTTDGNVGNREAALVVTIGGVVAARANSAVAQVASQTRIYTWFAGAQRGAPVSTNDLNVPLPPLTLPAGAVLESFTSNIIGADNWGPPAITVEEWIGA